MILANPLKLPKVTMSEEDELPPAPTVISGAWGGGVKQRWQPGNRRSSSGDVDTFDRWV